MRDTETPQPAPTYVGPPPPVAAQGSNGLATAGFVLGLLGLLGSWIPFLNVLAIILAVVGVILAAVGLGKSKRVGAGKGLAIAGLVLGVLAVIFAVLINAVFVSAVDEAIDETTRSTVESGSGSNAAGDKGSAKDEELGTTREKPAPMGSAITGGDWTVKVNSVKTTRADSIGQTAADGSILLLVNVTATYKGDDSQGETPWSSVKFVTADGNTIDSTSGSTLFIADNSFDSLKTVFKGASVKGDEILEVPADSWKDGVLAVSPGMLQDDVFVSVQ